MEKNTERADVGTTLAMRVYLDKYKNLKAFGQNKEGELDFNEDRALEEMKKNYKNSVDVSHLPIYQDQGEIFPTGQKTGETLTIKRNESGEIVSKEGIKVDDTLKEVYEMAEKAKKEA